MGKFNPGEIAIFSPDMTGDPECHVYAGHEVTIVCLTPWRLDMEQPYYDVDPGDGMIFYCAESCLRKRQPPESYKDQFTPASKDFNWREPVKGEVVA